MLQTDPAANLLADALAALDVIEPSPNETRLLVVTDAGSGLVEVGQPGFLPLPDQADWLAYSNGWATPVLKVDPRIS
jgi:hypothetical protein